MTQLLLVRHGEPVAATVDTTVASVPGTPGADPDLSARGHAQAQALATWIATSPDAAAIAEVVVSPMRRARQTASPALRVLGGEPTQDDDLAEFDRGQPTYRPVHERDDDDAEWQRIRRGVFPSFVDGPAFTARVLGAVRAVAARHSGRASVLVVCHAGVINTYLASVLGLQRPLTFPLDHTSVSRVLVSRTGERRVWSVNETQHVARVP